MKLDKVSKDLVSVKLDLLAKFFGGLLLNFGSSTVLQAVDPIASFPGTAIHRSPFRP